MSQDGPGSYLLHCSSISAACKHPNKEMTKARMKFERISLHTRIILNGSKQGMLLLASLFDISHFSLMFSCYAANSASLPVARYEGVA